MSPPPVSKVRTPRTKAVADQPNPPTPFPTEEEGDRGEVAVTGKKPRAARKPKAAVTDAPPAAVPVALDAVAADTPPDLTVKRRATRKKPATNGMDPPAPFPTEEGGDNVAVAAQASERAADEASDRAQALSPTQNTEPNNPQSAIRNPQSFDPHDPNQLIAAFRARYPFPLDAFQEDAIRYLAGGESVMVAAPTGTGKTVVAEFGVFRAHARGWRVIYTTPIKALSNQKFRDLRAQYGDAVGLLTGDIVQNRTGSILIMTTEVLRNMLLQSPAELWGVGCIVFDEIHYLADKERGTTWEESIIMCPPDVQLACLSATVSNAPEVADWISRTHRPVHLITHLQRAVPLNYYYYLDGEPNLTINARGVQVADFPGVGGEVRLKSKSQGAWTDADGDSRRARERPEPTPREIVDSLERRDMLPAIFFLFSRRDCEAAAEVCAMMRLRAAHEPVTRRRIDAVLNSYLDRLAPEDRGLEQVKTILYLARRGFGFHHAGLLPILKQLVEELFNQGLMRVVFATDTLALGVNMPARSVVIGRMSKWDGVSRRPLIPNELQQMAGRAGRRGIDQQGHVIIPYSPWVTFHEALAIATGPLRPVESAFTVRYNTILNLWNPPRGDRVLDVMRRSLLQFQQSRRLRDMEEGVAEWDAALAAIPTGCLIGLPAGEDLLSEYEALGRAVETGRDRARKLRAARERMAARRTALPWTRPDRETLRRLLRVFPPGGVVHIEQQGWAVYLAAWPNVAGLFWLGDRVIAVPAFSAIDFIPPQRLVVPLPDELSDLAGGLAVTPGAAGIEVSQEARAWMTEQLAGIELPDLEQWISSHQQQQGAELDAQLAQFDTQVTDAEGYLERVVIEERAHPCHTCPVRKQHRHNRRERGRAEAGRQEALDFLEERRTYEDTRLQTQLDGLIGVLAQFYYLDRAGEKTAKAERLIDIFDTNALLICETVEGGYLEGMPPADVAEAFSWFAYDRDIEFRNRNLLPGNLVQLRRRLDDLQRTIFGAERRHDLLITTGYNPYFYGVVRAWCRGASMADLLTKVELSEGDIVMAMTKTLDVMRQVREMLRRQEPDNPLYATLRQAEGLLRRGVVEMVNSIGFVQSEPGQNSPAPNPNPQSATHEGNPTGFRNPQSATGFADVDRMLGLLADPHSQPSAIPPPNPAMERPERPTRFPRTTPPADPPRTRPSAPPTFRERDRPALPRKGSGPKRHGPPGRRPGGKPRRGS